MLRSLKDFEHYAVSATDGDVGTVVNFLLDDKGWTVRYLVVATGGLLEGRRVLISPISFLGTNASSRRFDLALTVKKIEGSPPIETDQPVSRQHERDYSQYYGYPYYWGYAGLWGAGGYPGLLAPGPRSQIQAPREPEPAADGHLRSANELRGYHVEGSGEAVGHVDDFIVDDETWEVRYLVIDTSNWWFGKKVLIAPKWASRVSWAERKVHVDMSREAIKSSPEWNATSGVNRQYEARLYDYYGLPAYWAPPTRSEDARAPLGPGHPA